jgi:CheY-like chemotaxis protein
VTVQEAERLLLHQPAAALVVDTTAAGGIGWEFLAWCRLREAPRPPIVVTGSPGDESRASALGAQVFLAGPDGLERLTSVLSSLTKTARGKGAPKLVLVIDDEPLARYLVRKNISDLDVAVEEAQSGEEGLRLAGQLHPSAIVLDVAMPDMDGFDVLSALKSNPATKEIPVVIHTSTRLGSGERERLSADGVAVVGKDSGAAEELRTRLADLIPAAKLRYTKD